MTKSGHHDRRKQRDHWEENLPVLRQFPPGQWEVPKPGLPRGTQLRAQSQGQQAAREARSHSSGATKWRLLKSCAPAGDSFKKEIEAMWRCCGLLGLAEEAWGKWKVGYVSEKIQTTSCSHGPLLATFNTDTILHNRSIFFFLILEESSRMISFQDPRFPRVDGSPAPALTAFPGTNAGHSTHSQLLISHRRQMAHREEDGTQDHTIKRRPDPRISRSIQD